MKSYTLRPDTFTLNFDLLFQSVALYHQHDPNAWEEQVATVIAEHADEVAVGEAAGGLDLMNHKDAIFDCFGDCADDRTLEEVRGGIGELGVECDVDGWVARVLWRWRGGRVLWEIECPCPEVCLPASPRQTPPPPLPPCLRPIPRISGGGIRAPVCVQCVCRAVVCRGHTQEQRTAAHSGGSLCPTHKPG
jgi:hypothetical protein